MDLNLNGKTAIVTGGTTGLGAGIGRRGLATRCTTLLISPGRRGAAARHRVAQRDRPSRGRAQCRQHARAGLGGGPREARDGARA